jgi:dTDP-glucose pyrophosphorylase/predicted transcriptional regulator
MDTPARQRLDQVIISPSASVAEAVARLDMAGTGALVLCAPGRQLYGLLTDGDVRRAILQAKALDGPCGGIANLRPVTVPPDVTPAAALQVMNQHDINHLPVVDAEGEVQNFLLRRDVVSMGASDAGSQERLDRVTISGSASIVEAIERLDKEGTGALVLCSSGRAISGLLTDGDIRRAVLRGILLETPCERIASRSPVIAQAPVSALEALALMNQHEINHLPVVDSEGNLLQFLLRRDLVPDNLNLSAVIMAGGFGKRLLPLTERVPKPMLSLGDRPLLEHTIEQLRRAGIRDVTLTTHYLSERIVEHFGDGNAFGVNVSYLQEDHPLGTAGGLKLMKKSNGPFLVINGDILTRLSVVDMLNYHRDHGAEMTIGVRKYDVVIPFGVVECEDVNVIRLREKPSLSFLINAGIYILEPSACDYIPAGRRFDMTDLIEVLLEAGRPVVSFPVIEYWLDVGRQEDVRKAEEDLRTGRI